MARRLMQAAVVLVVIFSVAQFIRPQRANPPIDPSRTLQAHMRTANGLVAIVDRACRDVSTGKMPGRPWTQLHPEARLSSKDIETICATAQQADRGPSRSGHGIS